VYLPLSLPPANLTQPYLSTLAGTIANASNLTPDRVSALPGPVGAGNTTGNSTARVLIFPAFADGAATLPTAWPAACPGPGAGAFSAVDGCGTDWASAVRLLPAEHDRTYCSVIVAPAPFGEACAKVHA
jgi:hypothetical protein